MLDWRTKGLADPEAVQLPADCRLSSSQPLVCVFPRVHGSCPAHFVWQTHPGCLMAWRTRRPRVDLAVILQGLDRPDGASSASARPPKAPRTTSVTAAIPGTSPRTGGSRIDRDRRTTTGVTTTETGLSRSACIRKGSGVGVEATARKAGSSSGV